MGGIKYMLSNGGFSGGETYQTEMTITKYGITAKVVSKIDGKNHHEGLPMASNTSKCYLKKDENGKIEQMRIYTERRGTIDFDWGHKHKEKPEGVVHVHHYVYDKDGNAHRQGEPRYMNNDEMKKYGKFIKFVVPDVKLKK